MTVYIVLEEDRGIGVMVSGVYATEAQAQASCGSHNWVAEALFDDAEIRKECADRAVEAIGNIPPSKRSCWDTVESAIRAAIEGKPYISSVGRSYMESAFMFVEKWVETPSEEQGTHLGQLKRMVAERDAAIRKECADKADGWFLNNPEEWGVRIDGDEPVAHVNLTSLRAAIESRP